MSPGLEPFTQFEDWYQSPLGREVAAQEAACLAGMLEGIFGHYLLQVGGAARFGEVVAASPIRHRILLPAAVHRAELGMQIVASPEHLPVASDSLDAVLLAHSLDFAPDPRQVLREAERVLIPEGRLLILGFNALSPWGLWSLARPGGRVPWCGHFLTRYRVGDWLSLLGFDVESQRVPPPLAGLVELSRWGGPALLAGPGRRLCHPRRQACLYPDTPAAVLEDPPQAAARQRRGAPEEVEDQEMSRKTATTGVPMPERVEIFSDGACKGNPGPGGWGALLRFGAVEKELHGGEAHTTNNRMESSRLLKPSSGRYRSGSSPTPSICDRVSPSGWRAGSVMAG